MTLKTYAWNREHIWTTEVLESSANPARITWIWSAIWQEASKGIGWEIFSSFKPYCNVWFTDPRSNQDNNRIWATQSRNSRGPWAAVLAGGLKIWIRYTQISI